MRASDVFAAAEMIVKVKEPQPEEIGALREDQILFTYLHLAADRGLAEGLLRSGAVAIAYETVTDKAGGLPLLAPMSEVAGRMSVQVGAHCLEKEQGGMGILLGGVPGVPAAHTPHDAGDRAADQGGQDRNRRHDIEVLVWHDDQASAMRGGQGQKAQWE